MPLPLRVYMAMTAPMRKARTPPRKIQAPPARAMTTWAPFEARGDSLMAGPLAGMMGCAMTVALFAGIRVRDLSAARAWYERLLGEPSFIPNATEVVRTL